MRNIFWVAAFATLVIGCGTDDGGNIPPSQDASTTSEGSTIPICLPGKSRILPCREPDTDGGVLYPDQGVSPTPDLPPADPCKKYATWPKGPWYCLVNNWVKTYCTFSVVNYAGVCYIGFQCDNTAQAACKEPTLNKGGQSFTCKNAGGSDLYTCSSPTS